MPRLLLSHVPTAACPDAQFDVDGDGLISYPEFLLVLTLLSIHERDVKTIFDVVDLDGNGKARAVMSKKAGRHVLRQNVWTLPFTLCWALRLLVLGAQFWTSLPAKHIPV